MQNTAEWKAKKQTNFKAPMHGRKIVPNHRVPTPKDANLVACTQLRTMGVPKRRSCAPPAANKLPFPPRPARLDALRSVARMTDCPPEYYQPSHIVQVHSPRAVPMSDRNLKPASERTRTPKQQISAQPPEKARTARAQASRPAVDASVKVASPPASKPCSPVAGWLTSRLAGELADKERARMRSAINVAQNPPPAPHDWAG